MKFLFPEILYALGALAIPVIVHLFNFRKFKKVDFPNVAFLKEIKQETQSKSRIKHLLILLSRMLAMASIILAFAQPYIPLEKQGKPSQGKVVSVFLDNSFSMQGESEEGPLFEVAKNKALEIVESFAATDKFQLLTQDFEGRHQRLVNKDEMLELIAETGLSSNHRQLSEILSRQFNALSEINGDKSVFVLSDMQASSMDFDNCPGDTAMNVVLVATSSVNPGNVWVDSLWFDTPVRQLNEPERLHIRLGASGEEVVSSIPLELNINGLQKAIGSADADPLQKLDSALSFSNTETGWMKSYVEISEHPVTFDNRYYFSYEVADKIRVLEIKGDDVIRDYFLNLFGDDPFFVFQSSSEGKIDFNSFNEQDLVIVNQLQVLSSGLNAELKKFCDNGGTVLIIPSTGAEINSYNNLLGALSSDIISEKKMLESKVSSLNTQHYLYRGVFEKTPDNIDLPQIKALFPLRRNTRSASEELMGTRSGDPYLVQYESGKGRMLLFCTSLEAADGNLAQHAIFPATVLRVAEFAQAKSRLSYTIGEDQAIEIRSLNLQNEEVLKLVSDETGAGFIPEHRQIGAGTLVYVHNAITEAGHYTLLNGSDTIAVVSFNQNRLESDLEAMDEEELKSQIAERGLNYRVLDSSLESITKEVSELSEGKKLWLSMIILALIFLAIEILLIKFWK
jgi:hypothetical protein